MSNVAIVVGVLLFLGTVGLLGLGALAAGWALARGRPEVARGLGLGGLGLMVLYGLVLAGVSLLSRGAVLPLGQEKYFCEIDCHLAYAVTEVRTVPSIGTERAAGVFYLVTLRTRFDSTTISSRRGLEPLAPNPHSLVVLDADGHRYLPSPTAQSALGSAGLAGRPLSRPLVPAESYTTTFAFDLPAGVRQPRLLLTEDGFPTPVIIGHENSFFHAKTTFALGQG